MLIFAYCVYALLLSLRALILFFSKSSTFFCVLSAIFFLLLALPFTITVLSEVANDAIFKLLLTLFFIFLIGYATMRDLQTTHKKSSIWKKAVFTVAFFTLGIVLCAINSMENLTSEKPILSIELTGKSELHEMQWKTLHHPLQKQILPVHEIILRIPEQNQSVCRLLLPGELCAVRAKIFRFHPLLNALGFSNKYRLDLIYSGYRRAENYAQFPIEAHPICIPFSPFNAFLFKYWDSFFSMKTHSYWIKSATLESNYFPMEDESGKAMTGEFFLTLSSSGLSALAR